MKDDKVNFEGFPKIARLSRECIITEKIDGTNAQIYIGEPEVVDDKITYSFQVGSRSRWITPDDDNFGFARWAYEHKEELINGLGPGRHFGEWWGQGIQRNYGLKEKRFSLFNTSRWMDNRPECCHVVPIIETSQFDKIDFIKIILGLVSHGSYAAPGFMKPEGIVVFHVASGCLFKKTIDHDEIPKGAVR